MPYARLARQSKALGQGQLPLRFVNKHGTITLICTMNKCADDTVAQWPVSSDQVRLSGISLAAAIDHVKDHH